MFVLRDSSPLWTPPSSDRMACRDIGIHGIIINFMDQQGHHRNATFLPEVAAEEGWTKAQTIEHLVRKSGYGGPLTPELYAAIQLTTYRSSPCSLSYSEYQDLRQAATSAA